MTKNLKIGVAFFFVLQLILILTFELAHDEAYYWLYSQKLAWGYFDHPPFVALVIRAFSFLPTSEFSVRFGFVVLQLATLLILLKLVPRAHRSLAALLFLSFPLASFAGLFALPDIPLLFMSAVYLYLLRDYLDGRGQGTPWFLGLAIALLLMAKYHGILLVFFTLLAVPRLFVRKDFYLVTALALAGCVPHFLWQQKTGFLTLQYHFVDRPAAGLSWPRLGEYVGSQVFLAGLFAGPLVWWLALRLKTTTAFERVLKSISFGTVLFFFVSCFNKKVEANWTIFLALTLPLLVHGQRQWEMPWPRRLLWASVIVLIAVRFLLVTPVSSPRRLREFHGWAQWAMEVDEACQAPIMANTYQLASKLAFYLGKPVHAMNLRSRKNQFNLWPLDADYYRGPEVCFISDKRLFSGPEITPPDGKRLFLKDHQSLDELLGSK